MSRNQPSKVFLRKLVILDLFVTLDLNYAAVGQIYDMMSRRQKKRYITYLEQRDFKAPGAIGTAVMYGYDMLLGVRNAD